MDEPAQDRPFRPDTVGDWIARGLGGLRIPRCLGCGAETIVTWPMLAARNDEPVESVLDRMRCGTCKRPAGQSDVYGYDPPIRRPPGV